MQGKPFAGGPVPSLATPFLGDTCASMVPIPRERESPCLQEQQAVEQVAFPDHYEQTRIDGKEHPADVVINDLPVIIRFKRRLSKLSEELRQSVRDPKPFMAYVDTRGLYQSTRENLFFDAGFEHGLLAARQDCLAERMANNPVARRLLSEINQLT
jgi:hypothetical protein